MCSHLAQIFVRKAVAVASTKSDPNLHFRVQPRNPTTGHLLVRDTDAKTEGHSLPVESEACPRPTPTTPQTTSLGVSWSKRRHADFHGRLPFETKVKDSYFPRRRNFSLFHLRRLGSPNFCLLSLHPFLALVVRKLWLSDDAIKRRKQQQTN